MDLRYAEAAGRLIPVAVAAAVIGHAGRREQIRPTGVAAGMTSKPKTPTGDQPTNLEKPPEEWTTGDESMTGAQASYLKTLCEEAGEAFDPGLTKAQASQRIDALQARTGRGRTH